MEDFDWQKDLANHKVYSAWQFIKNTRANIAVAQFCLDTFEDTFSRMTEERDRSEKELVDQFENGRSIIDIDEDLLDFGIEVAGKKVNGFFVAHKMVRDIFQYLRNSFDSMSQVANAGLLANKGMPIDRTDFPAMARMLDKPAQQQEFPLTSGWFDSIKKDPEFQYIDAVCNRVKHTANINNQISLGLVGSEDQLKTGAFFRNDIQHPSKDLKGEMKKAIAFTQQAFTDFQQAFCAEYVYDLHVEDRYHNGIKVYQQYVKDEKESSFSVAYMISGDFASMPEEIFVLFLRSENSEMRAYNCPFQSLLVSPEDDYSKAVGRYIASEEVGIDSIVKYRRYIKDTSGDKPSIQVIKSMQDGREMFFHWNRFFDIHTISTDEQFLYRASLPF